MLAKEAINWDNLFKSSAVGGGARTASRFWDDLLRTWAQGSARSSLGRNLTHSAVGAGLGATLTVGEHLSGGIDPNMSREGQNAVLLGNMGLGAGLANPWLRRRLFTGPKTIPLRGSGLAPAQKTYTALRPGRLIGAAAVTAGVPKYVNMVDATAKGSRAAQQMLADPAKSRLLTDPTGTAKDWASRQVDTQREKLVNSPAAVAATQAFGSQFGRGMAALVGGGAAGTGLGYLAGKALAPDDEQLEYASRRRREQIRSALQLLGGTVGSVGGAYLLNRFNKQSAGRDGATKQAGIIGDIGDAARQLMPMTLLGKYAAEPSSILGGLDHALKQPVLPAAVGGVTKLPGVPAEAAEGMSLKRTPSGAQQLGHIRLGGEPAEPPPPGLSQGHDTLRIGLHGGGPEYNYTLGNYAQSPDTKEQSYYTLPAEAERAVGNPRSILSIACNAHPEGATPATLANNFHPPGAAPNLSHVVMTPPGHTGDVGAQIGGASLNGAFESPYFTEPLANWRNYTGATHEDPVRAGAHEYRLIRGGNPLDSRDWTDTGIYTDARASVVPLIGIHGEAQEFGRHLGLGPQLGGGNAASYLKKIEGLNNNPDATYGEKVRSNLARPVGSALSFGAGLGELGAYGANTIRSALGYKHPRAYTPPLEKAGEGMIPGKAAVSDDIGAAARQLMPAL